MKNFPVNESNNTKKQTRIILIVDDEADITQTFTWLLEWHGFEVFLASDGRQALEIFDKRIPDIVISDCMMPIMDGIELSRKVRGNPATQNIPIILMSAAPSQHKFSEAFYDVFLQKPFEFDALLVEVNKLLKT
jgi:DNA-binding response OmpR family regulator